METTGIVEEVVETTTKKNEIKKNIKELTSIQIKEKALLRIDHRKLDDAGKLQWMTLKRSIQITAWLNYYHEIRESEYRHNVRDENYWIYGEEMKKIKSI